MYSLILVIIYFAFISLGLPDPLLGSAWPVMHGELGVPLSYMGILSMIIALGTIISSIFTDKVAAKLGTGLLTAISVITTAVAMFAFSVSESFLLLCLWAVPYGLGAGAVDAALNNYVALNYAPRHMSWLHCFWGVGTVISPYIMGFLLTGGSSWHGGYFTVSIIQLVLGLAILISVPKWKRNSTSKDAESAQHYSKLQLIKTRGVPLMMASFFCYCALEATAGMWASSYLCEHRAVSENTAAYLASLFYIGITVGRLAGGFVTEKLGDRRLIKLGLTVLLAGIILVLLPVQTEGFAIAGLLLTGLGCAPLYPSMLNLTPRYFGRDKSLSIVGMQLASAYVGVNLMPTLFGFLTDNLWSGLYPVYLLFFAVLLILSTQTLDRMMNVTKTAADI